MLEQIKTFIMQFSLVDIGLAGLLFIALVFGFFGKAGKKITKCISAIAAGCIAYFTFDKIVSVVNGINIKGQSLYQFINGIILENLEVLKPMVGGILNIVVFWIYAILLFIVCRLIAGIINLIFKTAKNGTAWKTLGIFSVIRAIVVWFIILFPVFVFAPVLKNADQLGAIIPQLEGNAVVEKVATEMKRSKVLELTDKLFTSGKVKIFDYYIVDNTDPDNPVEVKKNIYNDLKSIGSLAKAAPLVAALQDENANPIEALQGMSEEDLVEVLSALDDNKELITSIVPEETFTDLGIDINTICFADEAPALAKVLSVIEVDGDGNMDINLYEEGTTTVDTEKVDQIMDAVAESQLLNAVLKPGMLAEVDADVKTAVIDNLDAKLDGNKISQEEYDLYKSYFEAQGE